MSGAPTPSLRVFISYRREDTPGDARTLYDELVSRFGRDIFIDIDTLELGADYPQVIDEVIARCDVLLALIGRQWLTTTTAKGRRRLDQPEDFVRIEIESALDRGIRVIPLLLQGVEMPISEELPEPLKRLARKSAIELSYSRWQYDVGRLVAALEKIKQPLPPTEPVRASLQSEPVPSPLQSEPVPSPLQSEPVRASPPPGPAPARRWTVERYRGLALMGAVLLLGGLFLPFATDYDKTVWFPSVGLATAAGSATAAAGALIAVGLLRREAMVSYANGLLAGFGAYAFFFYASYLSLGVVKTTDLGGLTGTHMGSFAGLIGGALVFAVGLMLERAGGPRPLVPRHWAPNYLGTTASLAGATLAVAAATVMPIRDSGDSIVRFVPLLVLPPVGAAMVGLGGAFLSAASTPWRRFAIGLLASVGIESFLFYLSAAQSLHDSDAVGAGGYVGMLGGALFVSAAVATYRSIRQPESQPERT